jgi:urea transport system permease protein
MRLWTAAICAVCLMTGIVRAETPRQIIARAASLTTDADEQQRLVAGLAGTTDPEAAQLLTLWKESGIFLATAPEGGWQNVPAGAMTAVTLKADKDAEDKQTVISLATNAPLLDAAGQPVRLAASDVEAAETDSELRRAMKAVLDLAGIAAPDPVERLRAVQTIGLGSDRTKLPAIKARLQSETDPKVKQALLVTVALMDLHSEDTAAQIAAADALGKLGDISSRDVVGALVRESKDPKVIEAAKRAVAAIDRHIGWVNFYGTLFRGLSGGSVLLVVAIGLAITFGLMGVINMAHGELIAIGAYTTYVVQNIFGAGMNLSPFGWNIRLPGLNATGWWYESYFLFALPLSFLTAAAAGVLLERGVIRFLYRRPLESLLATWGVSLVLQQMFKLVFGANNVQISSPSWLSGNWTVFDVSFGWNRVFVIAFAVAIITGTWALLTKTSFGLLIRAVTQNRSMAACMGVRTERINMMTFAFGSGLAGLAGAFISQLGSVGPYLGTNYIVDSFMTVVVGGVGSLFGTVISALSIGVADNGLQQILGNPVLGKILVLGAIILFLQWKPAGLFVTRSRNLES